MHLKLAGVEKGSSDRFQGVRTVAFLIKMHRVIQWDTKIQLGLLVKNAKSHNRNLIIRAEHNNLLCKYLFNYVFV